MNLSRISDQKIFPTHCCLFLCYGSVSERDASRSSSRASVSDRLKRFEILDATANNEKDVLNNPRKSVKQNEF